MALHYLPLVIALIAMVLAVGSFVASQFSDNSSSRGYLTALTLFALGLAGVGIAMKDEAFWGQGLEPVAGSQVALSDQASGIRNGGWHSPTRR
jgi:hypothetical protein